MNALMILAQQTDAGAAGASVVGGLLSLLVVFWTLAVAATVFCLWALIDALVNEPTTNDKILWFLVIFFLHFIGALVYVAVRRNNRGWASGSIRGA